MVEFDPYYYQSYGEWRVFCTGMPGFAMRPDCSALVIIDMQGLFAGREGALRRRLREMGLAALESQYFEQVESAAQKIALLKAAAERTGITVIYTAIVSSVPGGRDLSPALRHYGLIAPADSDESAIIPGLAPEKGQWVLERPCIGLFVTPTAAETFRNMGIDTLYLAGLHTNVAVESAARDGTDLGFKVAVVSDACAALTPEDHQQGLETMGMCFAVTMTTEELLKQMEQQRAAAAVWR